MSKNQPNRKVWSERLLNACAASVLPYVERTNMSANQITLISGIMGIIGVVLYPINHIVSSILLFTYLVLDLVDGDIARSKNQCSFLGWWSDKILDKIIETFIIFACLIRVIDEKHGGIIISLLMCFNYVCQFSMDAMQASKRPDNQYMIKGEKSEGKTKEQCEQRSNKIIKTNLIKIIDNLSVGHSTLILGVIILPIFLEDLNAYKVMMVMTGLTMVYLLAAHYRIAKRIQDEKRIEIQ